MRFYTQQHQYYCGIDWPARKMSVCILDQAGQVLVHRNMPAHPDRLLTVLRPYLDDIVIAVECMFTWYWIADCCAQHHLPFVLGHALYMKAIHGGKTKNDKIDSHKIAILLRGGTLPMASVYPAQMRSTRDLLRRRMSCMHTRAELLAHIQNTTSHYHLPEFGKKLTYKANRGGIEHRFHDPSVQKSIEVDLALLHTYDTLINERELSLTRHAKEHDANNFSLLRSISGVGKILALVMLYEIHDIHRFPTVQDFASYARLIKPVKESAGKSTGKSTKKIGNSYLKWAFSEATYLLIREREEVKKYLQKLEAKHPKGKALGILSHRLGRTVYYILKNQKTFDINKFLTTS